MPLITVPTFLAICDKEASQYKHLTELLATYTSLGGPSYCSTITITDDPDVELPMINPAAVSDMLQRTGLIVRGGFSNQLSVISSFESHFYRVGFFGGVDNYCATNNIRESDYFNQLFCILNGNWMYADNVFCESDSLFGTINILVGPVIQFVDGVNYGYPTPYRRATGGNFAATQLRIVVTTFGGVRCDLNITGIDKVGNLQTTMVTIPALTAPGTVIPIGTTATRYLDVGSVTYASANTGTVGDSFAIRNIKERIIS
jgi:hypothetical protein